MWSSRRSLGHGLALALVLSAQSALAAFPERPITWIVPFSAGGGTDILARLIAEKVSASIGQPIIIDNKPGGNTVIGTSAAVQAEPDGYTILFQAQTVVTSALLSDSVPYDIETDLDPVTLVARSPNILVANRSFPATTLLEFIELAKAQPSQISYGSSGVGGTGHLAMEMLKSMTGIELTHVAYRGGGPAMNALLGNEVPILFNQIVSAMPQVRAGELTALAVTGSERSNAAPEVPTVAEAGVPGFEATAWFGVLAPAGTPKEIIDLYQSEIAAALQDEAVRNAIVGDGGEPVGSTPEEFAAAMHAENERWATIIEEAGITAE